MSHARWRSIGSGVLALAGLVLAQAKEEAEVKKAFAAIQQSAAAAGEEGGTDLYTGDAFENVARDAVSSARGEMLAAVASGRLKAVDASGEGAVVTLTAGKGEGQLFLRQEAGEWKIASPCLYATGADELKARNGARPAAATLELHTVQESYGSSAFSFHHASSDAKACKNQIDVWACQNGDLHANQGTRIADLGEVALAKVQGIAAATDDWKTQAPISAGHS